jgi:hypothetical protein
MSPHASNRFRIALNLLTAIPCTRLAHPRTSLRCSPSSHLVPRWPLQLPAGGIQSPYIHRPSGLLQIAVSTLLRAGGNGTRELLCAEHCRYGTRDLSLTEKASHSFRVFDHSGIADETSVSQD